MACGRSVDEYVVPSAGWPGNRHGGLEINRSLRGEGVGANVVVDVR